MQISRSGTSIPACDPQNSATSVTLPRGSSPGLDMYPIGPITNGWSWKFWPTPGSSTVTGTPTDCRCSGSPIPDSISSFGDWTAPALTITSRVALAVYSLPSRTYVTPVQRDPSRTSRVASAPVRIARFDRVRAGSR